MLLFSLLQIIEENIYFGITTYHEHVGTECPMWFFYYVTAHNYLVFESCAPLQCILLLCVVNYFVTYDGSDAEDVSAALSGTEDILNHSLIGSQKKFINA